MRVRTGLTSAARSIVSRAINILAIVAILAPLASSPSRPTTSTAPILRGVYGRDSSQTKTDIISSTGFNAVTNSPDRAQLDALHARGLKALIWLGEYNRTAACQFERSDDWVRQVVGAVKGHPAIAAYQVSDEPNYARVAGCNAAADTKRRSDLIHSIDATKPTYVTISSWDGREGYPYQYFAGTTDIMGLVVYPCSYSTGCKMSMIDTAIAQANQDGVSRYWAVIQDFDDSWYRIPTADELRQQFDGWAGSRMEGYFVYHWSYGEIEQRADHLRTLLEVNSVFAGLGAPEPAPSPSPTVSSTPLPAPLPSASVPTTPLPTPAPAIDAAPGTVVARDSFDGSESGSWGIADLGGSWSVVSGSPTNFFLHEGQGAVSTSPSSSASAAHLGTVAVRDVDASVTLTFPRSVTGSGGVFGYLLLRRQSNGANYRVGLYATSDGRLLIRGQTGEGINIFSDVDTRLGSTAGGSYRLRVQVFGASPTTIRARAWRLGVSEPSVWAVSTTSNSSGLESAGSLGIRTINTSAGAGEVWFDDLLARVYDASVKQKHPRWRNRR